MLTINQHVEDNVHIFNLSGRFDTYTAPEVRQRLQEVTGEAEGQIVIDLQDVEFIDSTGLATLVQAMKRCRQQGGDLLLGGLQRPVRMVFELTRLDRAFTIYPTAADAISAVSAEVEEGRG